MRTIFLLIFTLILGVTLAFTGTIHVPKDQPTIQAGINAAADGDVVLVAEGIYFENINFLGKKIIVASHFYLDQQKIHIKRTIINGSKAPDPDFGSVVYFVSGEDTNSVLCGFTITGGTGTLNINPGFPPIRRGGGIFFGASGAKIMHNIIVNNKVENEVWCFGAGLSSGPPFIPAFIILEENVFRDNRSRGFDAASGGGAALGSSGRIINNVFEKNIVYSIDGSASGGGLDISSFPDFPNEVFVKGNIIMHNKALQQEGATYWLGGCGGGISILLTKGVIENNIIQHNEVSAANSSFSPGILFDFPPDEVYFRNNIVSHNTYSGAGTCYGGGFAIWDGNPLLENNLFENNKATLGGGGWIGDAFSSARIINNTFTKNQAEMGGSLYSKNATPTVMNSILWNNHAPQGNEIYLESGEIAVSYTNISGGWDGKGNLDVNPLFMTDLGLLNANSPCIDAGCSDEMYNDPENPWISGMAMFPARGTVCNDMGAYGGPGASGWRELRKEFAPPPVRAIVASSAKAKCFPNPFNSQTTIEFWLDRQEQVSLKIYNALGQEVANLIDNELAAGTYRILWDAQKAASGVYFYHLSYNGQIEIQKLLLLK